MTDCADYIRTINGTLADLAIVELKLAEARAQIATIRAMIVGRSSYADPADEVEALRGLVDEIWQEAGRE